MICPIKYNPAKYDECTANCAWVCVTEHGYTCALAILAVKGEDGIGINIEPMEFTDESFPPKPTVTVVEEEN